MTDDDDRELVYYYHRGRRHSQSSQIADKTKQKGLTKIPPATLGNIMIFISIIIIIAMIFISTRATGKQGLNLGGNTMAVTIVRDEGILVLNILKKAPQSGEVYLGAVDISVAPVEAGDGPLAFSHRIVFNPVDTEAYRVSLPFTGDGFFVTLRTANEQKSIRVNVPR